MAYTAGSSYLSSHYRWRHRFVAWVSRHLDNRAYTIRHGLATGLKRKGGLGFLPEWLAKTDTAETRWLAALDLKGKVVYDIGGFQGILTLYFARCAKAVVVYEPNPVSRQRLSENIALNGFHNVTIRPVGVGSEPGDITLVFDRRMPGGASAEAAISEQIGASATASAERIQIVRLDDDIASERLPAPEFVKIDVEGMELGVLLGMERTIKCDKPELYVEMHGATIPAKQSNARRVVMKLTELGYALTHVESGVAITPANAETAMEGHLSASAPRAI